MHIESCFRNTQYNDIDGLVALSCVQVLSVSFKVAIPYFLFCYFGLGSLKYTAASTQTAVSNYEWCYLSTQVIVGTDRLTTKKFTCVAATIVGVFMVNMSESNAKNSNESNIQLGIILAL